MVIIANPTAGHGRGKFLIERMPTLMQKAGVTGELICTQAPGDATRLAKEAIEKDNLRIVVMGGDGTITEVAQAILRSGAEIGLIPIGTGNDLARSLGVPFNQPARALEILKRWQIREIDVGWDGQRCFLSVMGIGYPALVAEEANRMQWLKGSPSFSVAVYKALRRMQEARMKIVLDGKQLEVGCTSILIHNTPYTGGGLKIAPMAELDDGYFDIVVVDLGRLGVMWNFPRIFWGTHLDHPNFKHYRSRAITVTAEGSVPKMQDGELIGELPAEVRVLPKALRLVV